MEKLYNIKHQNSSKWKNNIDDKNNKIYNTKKEGNMSKKIETGLIVVKDDAFSRIRRKIFRILFKEESRLLDRMWEIEQPKNHITGKIVIPKEINIEVKLRRK